MMNQKLDFMHKGHIDIPVYKTNESKLNNDTILHGGRNYFDWFAMLKSHMVMISYICIHVPITAYNLKSN
jgi:hypothetical protein